MPDKTTYKTIASELLTSSFDAELTRLLSSPLPDELALIARRYYSDKERAEMDSSDFCGPHRSFPVQNEADFKNAVHLVGHAENPDAVKSCLKRKAKTHGWTLPDSWQDNHTDDKERTMPPSESVSATEEQITIDRAGNHAPMSGKHAHAHPSFGSQGDDETHSHEHSHDNDAEHKHAHADASDDNTERASTATLTPESLTMYAPLTRVDKDSWVIEGQATSEAVDSYGTVFEYDSSKKAFQRWMQRGNIREQHDPRKAVGKALAVEFDDANKIIYVRARISKGAKDTWEKILDGTLSGFSIGVPAASAKKRFIQRGDKSVPCYYDHELNELSVVDAPGSPNCDIAIARADGMITDVVDDVAEETTTPETFTDESLDRAGKTISASTSDKIHKSIAHTLHAAVAQMQTCNCDNCMKAQKLIDPDGDGDIDIGSFDDPDEDANDLYNGRDGEMDRAVAAIIERIDAKLTPVYQRLQAIAGNLARSQQSPLLNDVEATFTRALQSLEAKFGDLPTRASLDEVRTEMSVVKGQVERIANTPMPGAPVQYASATQRPQPVEKRLPTDPYQSAHQRSGSSVYDALAQMSAQGWLDTPEQQTDAIAAGLLAQRQGR